MVKPNKNLTYTDFIKSWEYYWGKTFDEVRESRTKVTYPRESDIEKHSVAAVKEDRGEVRKVKWIGRAGAPDRIIFIDNKIIFVELKAPGRKPTPAQKREHERLRNKGADVRVIDSFGGVTAFIESFI